uniref:Truncated alcohol dehydrogenase n=1 Tax=Fusarium oxysporum f. sp. lycopersici TaxID=59765 RepID=E3UTR0_FUSOX|nr:truncated alcohol dehydrogenase [Fusarium oxysporum f. sp. lycopersici]
MAAPQIPEKQWAQVFEKTAGPIEYKQIPVQKPGPDEVLVNVKFSGVCHTDLLTGPSIPSCLLSVATRVLVLSLPAATLSRMSRLARRSVSSGSTVLA